MKKWIQSTAGGIIAGLLIILGLNMAELRDDSRKKKPSSLPAAPDVPEKRARLSPVQFTEAEQKELWDAEATFYGRVLDLEGVPVVNATVGYMRPTSPFVNDREQPKNASTRTDADGNFSIIRYKAPSLSIGVTAEGYYSTPEAEGYYYFAQIPASVLERAPNLRLRTIHQPDPKHPVIFRHRKMGPTVPLYHSTDTLIDGKPLTFSLDYRRGIRPPDSHNVLVEGNVDTASIIRKGDGPNDVYYDWWIELSVPGGGLVERREGDGFTAPESGYRSKIRVEYFAANAPSNWTRSPKLSYFVRFPDATYASISVDMSIDERSEGSVMAGTGSFYDPSGGRYFEKDGSKILHLKAE